MIPVGAGWTPEECGNIFRTLSNKQEQLYPFVTVIVTRDEQPLDFLGFFMSGGHPRHDLDGRRQPRDKRLLMLAGAFPDPGWGLLVDASASDRAFACAREALCNWLGLPDVKDIAAAFVNARDRAEELRSCSSRPRKEQRRAAALLRARSLVNREDSAGHPHIDDKRLKERWRSLLDLRETARRSRSATLFDSLIECAMKIRLADGDRDAVKAIAENVQTSDRNLVFRMAKHCAPDHDEWHRLVVANIDAEVEELRRQCIERIEAIAHNATVGQESDTTYDTWASAVQDSVEIQKRLSVSLLTRLKQKIEDEVRVEEVPWDQPRAFAAKLASANIVRVGDLREFAADADFQLKAPPTVTNSDAAPAELIYDWVCAASRRADYRDAARSLLLRLRQWELATLLPEKPESDVARKLLDVWGWECEPQPAQESLAAWLAYSCPSDAPHEVWSAPLRRIIESLRKDLGAVCRARLSEWAGAVEDAGERSPWEGLRKDLRSGFATDAATDALIDSLSDSLRDAYALTSETLHHNVQVPDVTLADAIALARRILQSALDLVGELPWHMNVQRIEGNGPYRLSGKTWSHSFGGFEVKTIVWHQPLEGRVAMWNRSHTNPVAVDVLMLKGI